MTATEDLLRDTLRSRAKGATHRPTPVGTVAAGARTHQRRTRVALSTAAVAAVAAVTVPLAFLLGPGASPRPEPMPPSDAPTVELGRAADLPEGAPPAIDHVDDRTYVFAAGGTLELPVADGNLLDAAPYLGGVLVVTAEAGVGSVAPSVTLLDRDGDPRWSRCGSDLVTSADGDTTGFAWLEGDCGQSWSQPRVEWGPVHGSGPTRGGPLDPGQRIDPVAVTADRLVYGVTGTPREEPRVEIARASAAPVTVPGLVYATAYEPGAGLVAGCTPDDGCGLVDEAGHRVLMLEDPLETPVSFSPDGRLLATATIPRDSSSTTLMVRDVASGDLVVTLRSEAVFRGNVAWEGSDHLLFALVDRSGEALVRLGLDGALERATAVREPTLGGYLLPSS